MHYLETSSKSGFNVEEAFMAITEEIHDRILSGEYKIEDGWEGIKAGFANSERRYMLADPNGVSLAEPAKSSCC